MEVVLALVMLMVMVAEQWRDLHMQQKHLAPMVVWNCIILLHL